MDKSIKLNFLKIIEILLISNAAEKELVSSRNIRKLKYNLKRHIHDIYDFALRFLVCTFNECSVEAQVSFIGQIETSQRPLKHDMA